jgi:hypothetical protein
MHTFKKEIVVNVEAEETGEDRLAEVDREILTIKSEKKETNRELNGRIKVLEAEQEQILKERETGKRTIAVDCYEEIDEQRLEMVTKRVDNDQILPEFTRPLTAQERQVGIPEPDEEADDEDEDGDA